MNVTTMRVYKETIERLKELGKKGETYDDILNKLVDYYEQGGKNERKSH